MLLQETRLEGGYPSPPAGSVAANRTGRRNMARRGGDDGAADTRLGPTAKLEPVPPGGTVSVFAVTTAPTGGLAVP